MPSQLLVGAIGVDSLDLRGHRFPRHAHSGWSISVVEGGTGYFRCSGMVHRAPRGAITVLHPGEGHDGWVCREEGLRYLVLSLPEGAVETIFGCPGTPSFASRVVDDPRLASSLVAAARRLLAGDTDGLREEGVVVEALDRLFHRHAQCRHGSAPSQTVDAVRRYLDDRFAGRVTLRDLAAVTGLHPAALLRRFRAETGVAPYEYVVSRRVEVARGLLANGQPAAEVSARTGFADQSHLTRHFKAIVGVTPSRFARREVL